MQKRQLMQRDIILRPNSVKKTHIQYERVPSLGRILSCCQTHDRIFFYATRGPRAVNNNNTGDDDCVCVLWQTRVNIYIQHREKNEKNTMTISIQTIIHKLRYKVVHMQLSIRRTTLQSSGRRKCTLEVVICPIRKRFVHLQSLHHEVHGIFSNLSDESNIKKYFYK